MVRKKFRKFKRSKRGISPIVAEMLLIGLTMLAGAITFTTVFVFYNSKPPIYVTIDSYSDFKLDNATNSTKYNSFGFVLDNQGQREVALSQSDFSVIDPVTNKPLTNWTLSRDYELAPYQSYYITATSNNSSTWLGFGSTIKVQLTVQALDNGEKSIVTSSITVDSTLVSQGPLQITSNTTALNANNPTNNSVSIDVLNYGNLPVNYTLEFIVSNVNMTIVTRDANNNILSSIISGNLTAAIGNSPSSTAGSSETVTLTVGLEPSTPIGNYFVMVWLKIGTNIQDSLLITCS